MIESVDDIENFDDFDEEDQETVRAMIQEFLKGAPFKALKMSFEVVHFVLERKEKAEKTTKKSARKGKKRTQDEVEKGKMEEEAGRGEPPSKKGKVEVEQ